MESCFKCRLKKLLSIFLSLFLGLFLADAVISLVDDSLIVFFGLHLLGLVSVIISLFAVLMAIAVYLLMGLTPLVPKRVFLPLALFYPVATLASIPFSIYYHAHFEQISWVFSLCQVAVGLAGLFVLGGGFKFRWPLVSDTQLGFRGFSWLNLSGFLLINIFIVPVAAFIYCAFCASLAVDHFSDGFIALRPGGFTVRVADYVRSDGKKIRLIPMAHIGESEFYLTISESFPSNSTILMEGVTDDQNLLTNKLTYKKMATSLGLAEQQEKFEPQQGEIVYADVDVSQFSSNTIAFLNLVTLFHSKGVNAQTLPVMIQYSPPANFQDELLDNLLTKRNRHLLDEIQLRLPDSANIMVPWGVAHMPGIAAEIKKSGFHETKSQEYYVIRFNFHRAQK